MKKSLIYLLLVFLAGVVGYVLLGDIFFGNPQKKSKNPYAYDLGDIYTIDPSLIKFKESKRIALTYPGAKALHYYGGHLAIAYKNQLQVIDTAGREVFSKSINNPATAIYISADNEIFLAAKSQIEVLSADAGNLLRHWEINDSASYITGFAIKDNQLFIADAGKAAVRIYTLTGEEAGYFDGKNQTDNKHGIIIPSPYFDIDFDPEGQLWVANTGIQAIENYSSDGTLRAFWGMSGYDLAGFIGCCNPAHFCIMANGNFATCEKGIVRIKEYLPSGELKSVIASPDVFDANSEPADLTSDESNSIYALDVSRNMIRKFEHVTE